MNDLLEVMRSVCDNETCACYAGHAPGPCARCKLAYAELRAAIVAEEAQHWFPILKGYYYDAAPHPLRIPWHVAELAYSVYAGKYGTDQTLTRIAGRGGFSPGEMDDYLPNWREFAKSEGEARLDTKQNRTPIAWAVTCPDGTIYNDGDRFFVFKRQETAQAAQQDLDAGLQDPEVRCGPHRVISLYVGA